MANQSTIGAVPIETPAFGVEIDELVLKFIWNCKAPQIVKTILKNKVGRLILLDSRTTTKLQVIKTAVYKKEASKQKTAV